MVDNNIWLIESNLSFSHPPNRGQDTKETRAFGVSGQRPHGGKGAAPELRTGKSAQRWRSGVKGGSEVVEIGAGERWMRLRLYGVGR